MRYGFGAFHPAVPFLYFCSCIGLTMFVREPHFQLLSFCCAGVYLLRLNGIRRYVRRLPGCLLLILFFAGINGWTSGQGLSVLFYLGGTPVTREALLYGATSGLMVSGVLLWFACMQQVLSSGRLVALLGRAAPTAAMMVSMVFRYIPELLRRGREILEVQKGIEGRAGDADGGRLRSRWRLGMRTASVLLGWTMENSLEMTASMQARGYGIRKRTRYLHQHFRLGDGVMAVILLFLTGLGIWRAISSLSLFRFYPYIGQAPGLLASLCICGILFLFPLLWEGKEALLWR